MQAKLISALLSHPIQVGIHVTQEVGLHVRSPTAHAALDGFSRLLPAPSHLWPGEPQKEGVYSPTLRSAKFASSPALPISSTVRVR